MPSRYTRFGEFFMQGLAQTLAEGTPVNVPHVGECQVRSVAEPRMHHSNWSLEISIGFPGKSPGQMKIDMYTSGSILTRDTEAIPLPEPTYPDENDSRYPKEHGQAWYHLLLELERQLGEQGLRVGSSDDADIHFMDDYWPSDGISASVLKPSALTEELVALCQRLVQADATWNFWVRLGFDFVDERHKGYRENVLVRPDRVVHDYDRDRLRNEFGDEIPLLVEELGSS